MCIRDRQEMARLQRELSLRSGPDAKVTSTNATADNFSCAYVYRDGSKFKLGRAEPETLADSINATNKIGRPAISRGVCRN